MSEDTGHAVTVDGRVEPSELGLTLPHEHMVCDFADALYTPPDSAYEKSIANEPLSLDNLWFVQQNPLGHKDNYVLDSFEDAVSEVGYFHQVGGDTIVDVTPKNVGGDPDFVRAVARESGVNFVHGTAHYMESIHPPYVADATIDELEDEFVSDVTEGIGSTDVRAGIVGEIGLSGRIEEDEEKVLRAGARAAAKTGASLTIHPPGRTDYSRKGGEYPTARWGLEILDIVEEEGLPPERVIICHMDRSLEADISYQKKVADRGAYIEYDLWGLDGYLPHIEDGFPSDHWRVDAVDELIDDGYAANLLLSHDAGAKSRLRKYGGPGLSYLFDSILPRLETRGASKETLEQITIENPQDMLTFDSPL
jgi:phosphotriesterase-related protein